MYMGKCYTIDSSGNNERGLIEFKNINSFISPVSKSFYDNGVFGVREALKNKPYDKVLGAAQFTEHTMHQLSKVVISCQKLS